MRKQRKDIEEERERREEILAQTSEIDQATNGLIEAFIAKGDALRQFDHKEILHNKDLDKLKSERDSLNRFCKRAEIKAVLSQYETILKTNFLYMAKQEGTKDYISL
jgi:predicted component of type VI protein secretion system